MITIHGSEVKKIGKTLMLDDVMADRVRLSSKAVAAPNASAASSSSARGAVPTKIGKNFVLDDVMADRVRLSARAVAVPKVTSERATEFELDADTNVASNSA